MPNESKFMTPDDLTYYDDKIKEHFIHEMDKQAHDASDINSGTLDTARLPVVPIAKGGTNASTVNEAQTNLLGDMNYVIRDLTDDDNVVMAYKTPTAEGGAVYKYKLKGFWNYINAKIQGVFGFNASGVLDIAHGGTASTNAVDARNAIGAAAASHTHAADDITSGVLDVARIPMDSAISATSVKPVQNKIIQEALLLKQDKLVAGSNITIDPNTNMISADGASDAGDLTGVLDIAHGGTGATNKADAVANLGIKSWLLNNVFKVGYVWVSYTSMSPASIIGGSWTAITGHFPYFNAGTSTGGSNTHTLTADQLADHRHSIGLDQDAYYAANADSGYTVHKSGNFSDNGYSTWAWSGGLGDMSGTQASGHEHNNMPAYQTLYAWRRTA